MWHAVATDDARDDDMTREPKEDRACDPRPKNRDNVCVCGDDGKGMRYAVGCKPREAGKDRERPARTDEVCNACWPSTEPRA